MKRYTVILGDHCGYADYRVIAQNRTGAVDLAMNQHYELDTSHERAQRVSSRSHQAKALFVYAGWPARASQ